MRGAAAVAAAVMGVTVGGAYAANAELDVLSGTTDLTALGATSASDLTFTATTYSPAAFTVNSSLAVGTLNDKSSTALTVSNAGGAAPTTLTLSTAANSVSGTAADLLYVAGGGNLTIAGGSSSSTLGVTLGTSGNFNVAGSATVTAAIDGSGLGITKTGNGTLSLGAANTYTGATALSAGTLQLTNTAALANTAVTFSNAARLDLRSNTSATFATGGMTLAGNNGTFNFNVDGLSGGTGQTLTLGGTIGFSGVTTGGNTINVTSASGSTLALGTVNSSSTGGINQYLNAVGSNISIATFSGTSSGTSGLLLGGNGNFTFGTILDNGNNRQISPTINTSGTVTINGSAVSTINQNSSGTANNTVTLNNGTLSLDFSNLATPTNLINLAGTHGTILFAFSGGTLSINGKSSGATSQNLFGGTTFNPGASAISLTNNGTSATVNLNAITRNAGGTVDFSATSGTTFATNGSAITSTTTNVNGILGGYATVAGTTWAVAPSTSGQAITGLVDAGYSNTSSTALSGAATTANIDVAAAGANASSAAQVVNSLRFNDGAGSASVNAANGLTLATGGILVTSAVGANPASITGGTLQGAPSADLVVIQNNTSAALTIGSTITDNTAATALTKSGNGTLALTNTANTFTGKTFLNAGTLSIAADASLGVAPASVTATQLTVSGGTLQFASAFNLATNRGITLGAKGGAIDTNGFDTAYAGVIAGVTTSNGTLTKLGAGQLTLSGTDTYAGGTLVSAGTLLAANAAALGSGQVTVGGGTLTSNVASLTNLGGLTVSSGSLSPNGTGVGTFALAAGRNFNLSGGTLAETIASATSFDKITGSGIGAFAITGGTLDLSSSTGIDYTKTYALLSGFTGGVVSNLSISGYDTANYAASLNTAGVLSFTAVPEPTSLAAIGGVALTLSARRRKRS